MIAAIATSSTPTGSPTVISQRSVKVAVLVTVCDQSAEMIFRSLVVPRLTFSEVPFPSARFRRKQSAFEEVPWLSSRAVAQTM